MSDEARQALAFVARRQAKAVLPASDWAHVLSLELGWLDPKAAKRYVRACAAAGLLEETDDGLRITFDEDATDIPRGFRLDRDSEPPKSQEVDPFLHWVDAVAAARGTDRADVLTAVSRLQDDMGGMLEAEAAALLLAAEAGLDVQSAAAAALERFRKANGPG